MKREEIFARLIAVATVLGDRVLDKDAPSISSQFLDRLSKQPAKTIGIIHEKLLQNVHRFGAVELEMLDLFGELVAELDIEEFNNDPLDSSYLVHYYKQKHDKMQIVGYKEATELIGWDYKKNRTMLNTYLKRAEEFGWPEGHVPKPLQVLASGPIWYKYQIDEYAERRNSRVKDEE